MHSEDTLEPNAAQHAMAEANTMPSQAGRASLESNHAAHPDRRAFPPIDAQSNSMAALLHSLGNEAASAQATNAPALLDLLRRLADFHTAERPLETPGNHNSAASPGVNVFPSGVQHQHAISPVMNVSALSVGAQDLLSGSHAVPSHQLGATPQPSGAFDGVRVMIDSPQHRAVDGAVPNSLGDGNRQQLGSAPSARLRLNRQFRSRQLPAPINALESGPTGTTSAQPVGLVNGEEVTIEQQPPVSVEMSHARHALIPARTTAPPRHSPPQLDPRPSVRLRLSDGSGDAGVFFDNRDRVALPAPFQQFTVDATTGRMPALFATASDAGVFRPSTALGSQPHMVAMPDLMQPLSTSAPPTVLRTTTMDALQPFAEPNWPEVPVAVTTDESLSSSGLVSGSVNGSDGDREAPERAAVQHANAEGLAKHAAALPVGFALQLDVRLKQGLHAARDVDPSELTRILQAYLHAMGPVLQEYEAAGALVAKDASSMAPCATSLDLLCDRVKLVCSRARSALSMQGSGRYEAMIESEKHLAAVLHGNVLHKTALFARCTIVPCLEDDVSVASLPSSHASLLYAINNHVRTMRSTQLRRFHRRQGATAFAAAAASLVRAQPSVLKPCPTWVQARLARPPEASPMEYSALQVLVSASLPPLTSFSAQPFGRHWAPARMPPPAPGRGGGRAPGAVRQRSASDVRAGRSQRPALSISPAGGLGTDNRRARGSGGGHRSTGVRTRPRPDPIRDAVPAPTAAEFPDSLVAYILELFGRTDPLPQQPETLREVGTTNTQHTDPSGGIQDAGGTAVAERLQGHDGDEADSIVLPELVSPRPRRDAVIWFDQPLEGVVEHAVPRSIPENTEVRGNSRSQNLPNSQASLLSPVVNVQDAHGESGVHPDGSDLGASQPTSFAVAWADVPSSPSSVEDSFEGARSSDMQEGSANAVHSSRTSVVQRLLRVLFGGS